MGGGLPWWLAATECSPPSHTSLAGALAFLFLSPCPQRALLGAVDLLFVLTALALSLLTRRATAVDAATPEREPLLPAPAPTPSLRATTARYAVGLGASALLAAAAAVFLALSVPAHGRILDCAFLAVHSAAHAAAAWTVFALGKRDSCHPPHLRVFWIATAIAAALFSASSAIRCADGSPFFPDDVLSFAFLLLSIPLSYIAITGGPLVAFTAPRVEEDEPELRRSATPYVTASFLSRATFSWINPLVSKGHADGSLAADDVPSVSPSHRAEEAYALLASNWPAAASASRSPVGVALWLSFWPQLVLTAVLGLMQLAAMYVGPSLIDRFVEFIRRGGTPWEGLRLVLTLLVGKAVQTLASHHYNFQGQLLGIRISAVR
jgi:ATP-binding cassette subfamily C (CFTR/MRP) protein 1